MMNTRVFMWRGARVAESGGLENRCTLTGTVGSNPTLSAREERQGNKGTRRGLDNEDLLPLSLSPVLLSDFRRDRLIGMAPRWKRGGSKGLCGFESRSLRFYDPKSQILDLNLRLRTPCNPEHVNPARTGR